MTAQGAWEAAKRYMFGRVAFMPSDAVAMLDEHIGRLAELERERDEARNRVRYLEEHHAANCATVDAARAESAMLRSALERAASWGLNPPGPEMSRPIQDEYLADVAAVRAALSASGSDWLAEHDRELPLPKARR
jgi:hypothetical protein